jgi:hypothetical protein
MSTKRQHMTSTAAKFLTVGVLSPSRTEIPLQDLMELEANEKREGVRQVLKKVNKRLEKSLKSLGMMLLLGIVLAACSAKTLEDKKPQAAKVALAHYHPPIGALPHYDPPRGVFSGHTHWITREHYLDLQNIILQKGGDPSLSNVDSLYDSLRSFRH